MNMNFFKRFTAAAVAFVMVVLMVPFGALVASAATNTFVFDATTLSAAVDKEAIEAGSTVGTNGYFTVAGTVQKRTTSNGVGYVELVKKAGGTMSFKVGGSADVTIVARSTGSSNTSDIALRDASGATVANNENIATITGTAGVTVTYSALAAGTYTIMAPADGANTGRGVQIISIEVVETADHVHSFTETVVDPTCTEQGYTTYTCDCGYSYNGSFVDATGHNYDGEYCVNCYRDVHTVDAEYVLNASTDLTDYADGDAVTAGTYGTDGYFTLAGTSLTKKSSKYLELGKNETGTLSFTVLGEAVVTIGACSTGSSNFSDIVLMNADNEVIANNEGITNVTTTNRTELTYNLYAGTYTVASPVGSEYNRGVRLYDVTVVDSYVPTGSEAHPTMLMEQENAVTNAGTTYYGGYFSGMIMTVTGEGEYSVIYNGETLAPVDGVVSTTVSSSNPREPVAFAIVGDGNYTVNFAYPVGNMSNPAELVIGENTASIEAGNQGYYYTWTAEEAGTLTITMPEGDWMYVVNNMTSYVYGDTQWSDNDPVMSSYSIEVAAGDEIQIMVSTYDPANPWSAPAGELVITAEFAAAPGTESNPILLTSLENSVTNAGTLYYQGRFSGMVMTITGEGDFSVIYNGVTTAAVDGVVSMAVSSSNPRMPVVFAITGDGDYAVNFAYPEGTMDNPDELVIGENTASIEAGNVMGYYYTWTAPEAGKLTITMPEGDWMYAVNNMTTYTYGETLWSDSDPVMSSYTIEVAAGDELQIMVNTYDPNNTWSNPAGELVITASFEGEASIVEVLTGASYNIRLVEPWALRINVMFADANMSPVNVSNMASFGAYAIRGSLLDGADVTAEALMADPDAVSFSSEDGTMTGSGTWLVFDFFEGLYTYRMSDPIYWVAYYVDADGNTYYSAVRSKSLHDQMVENNGKDGFKAEEKAVYTDMLTLEERILSYRADFEGATDVVLQNTDTLASTPIAFGADQNGSNQVKFGSNYYISLVEPWGVKLNTLMMNGTTMVDFAAADDYGVIVYQDKNGLVGGDLSADAFMNLDKENTYVFSKSQGTMGMDGTMASAIYNEGIYTFELDLSVYFLFYLEVDGQYYYASVREVNLYDEMVTRLAGVTDLTKELSVYETMLSLCDNVKSYRETL